MALRDRLTRMGVRTAVCVIGVVLTLSVAPALADCQDDVAALTKRAAATTDLQARADLAKILKQAEFELWEGDEAECESSLSGAAHLLQQSGQATADQPGTTTAPSSP